MVTKKESDDMNDTDKKEATAATTTTKMGTTTTNKGGGEGPNNKASKNYKRSGSSMKIDTNVDSTTSMKRASPSSTTSGAVAAQDMHPYARGSIIEVWHIAAASSSESNNNNNKNNEDDWWSEPDSDEDDEEMISSQQQLQKQQSQQQQQQQRSVRLCDIIDRTTFTTKSNDGTTTDTSWRYYVHYRDFNRRMDEWITIDRIVSPPSVGRQKEKLLRQKLKEAEALKKKREEAQSKGDKNDTTSTQDQQQQQQQQQQQLQQPRIRRRSTTVAATLAAAASIVGSIEPAGGDGGGGDDSLDRSSGGGGGRTSRRRKRKSMVVVENDDATVVASNETTTTKDGGGGATGASSSTTTAAAAVPGTTTTGEGGAAASSGGGGGPGSTSAAEAAAAAAGQSHQHPHNKKEKEVLALATDAVTTHTVGEHVLATVKAQELDEHEGLDEASLREHEEVTKVKNVNNLELGEFIMETWYFSPLPKEILKDNGYLETLYACEFTFNLFPRKSELLRFQSRLPVERRHPPGNEIYRKDNLSMFEVDGLEEKIYCQNLCYIAKLFLDHKTLYFDVDPFLFYVLCEVDERGFHPVGYYSKEKYSDVGYNLACILTFPAHQRKGYGRFLISFSYELTKKEEKVGSPEKPMSDLGQKAYIPYWASTIVDFLLNQSHESSLSIMDISKKTSVMAEDIVFTLNQLGILKIINGVYFIAAERSLLQKLAKRHPVKEPRVDPTKLHWTPFLTDVKRDKFSVYSKKPSIEIEEVGGVSSSNA